jgi:hypothetical protein
LSAKSKKPNPEAAIERISVTAFSDGGYREQLVSLADSHGGIYAAALEALYAIEREQLAPAEAVARVDRDRELVKAARGREQRRALLATIDASQGLVKAAESTARAVREHELSKLVRAALADDVYRQRVEALAKKRVKRNIYAEALALLEDDSGDLSTRSGV